MAIFHSYVTNYWKVTISTNVFGTALPSRRNLWSCLLPRKSHPKTKQQNVGKTCTLYIGIFSQQKRHLTKELWIAGKLWFEQQHVGVYIYIEVWRVFFSCHEGKSTFWVSEVSRLGGFTQPDNYKISWDHHLKYGWTQKWLKQLNTNRALAR